METIPAQIRIKLANTIEEIGQAMCLLRESDADVKQGNHEGSRITASDALEIIATLETTFSEIAASLAKYSE